MRKGDSMDSPSGGFAILYQLQSRGGVPQEEETPRPLGKTARYQNDAMHASTTRSWVQNRSCVTAGRQAGRQAEIGPGSFQDTCNCVQAVVWKYGSSAAPARCYCCVGHWRSNPIMRVIHGR